MIGFAGLVIFICVFFLVVSSVSHTVGSQSNRPYHNWHTGSPMPTPRFEISACILDGKVYVIGGVDKNEYLTDNVEVYDPETNSWRTVAPIPEPLDHTGLASHNGKLYLIGGFGEKGMYRVMLCTSTIRQRTNGTRATLCRPHEVD